MSDLMGRLAQAVGCYRSLDEQSSFTMEEFGKAAAEARAWPSEPDGDGPWRWSGQVTQDGTLGAEAQEDLMRRPHRLDPLGPMDFKGRILTRD